jgi:hypothetical protein
MQGLSCRDRDKQRLVHCCLQFAHLLQPSYRETLELPLSQANPLINYPSLHTIRRMSLVSVVSRRLLPFRDTLAAQRGSVNFILTSARAYTTNEKKDNILPVSRTVSSHSVTRVLMIFLTVLMLDVLERYFGPLIPNILSDGIVERLFPLL